jgi:MraZ protein
MFLGTHEPKLDEKGRLILPAKFREELSSGLVITKGQERCLYVFPQSEFVTITETLRQAPVTQKAARDYSRVMFAGAHDEIPDRQGRVTIPQSLREYANLEKACVVIGANTRVEIWMSPRRYSRDSFKNLNLVATAFLVLTSLPRSQSLIRRTAVTRGFKSEMQKE